MNPIERAFGELTDAAQAFSAALGEEQATKRLAAAALEYARVRWSAKTGSNGRKDAKPSTSTVALPFGRSKGKPIGEASTGELRFVLGVVEESIDDESKARWRASNISLRDSVRAELANRGDL
jgi:hypothetical protein